MSQPEGTSSPDSAAADSPFADAARTYAERSGLQRGANGHIDVLQAAGGVRGIAESVLPGAVFLALFTMTHSLNVGLIASIATAAIFTVARLIQRQPLTQALAGIVGVVISAFFSRSTGEAKDYYVAGFIVNGAYLGALLVSVFIKWPLLGLLYGYVRNEGLRWRHQPARLRAYRLATCILILAFALRFVVQLPLYFANQVEALGVTRILMGVPLYALGLWLAWLMSRPTTTAESTVPAEQPDQD